MFDGPSYFCYPAVGMPSKNKANDLGNINLRGIPKTTIFRLKMAAAAEHRTVKELLLELIEVKIQELEKRGILPKGKA